MLLHFTPAMVFGDYSTCIKSHAMFWGEFWQVAVSILPIQLRRVEKGSDRGERYPKISCI